MRVAGIMSGTSLDGIDVAIVDLEGRGIRTAAYRTTPYPDAVRRAILAASNTQTTTAAISRLNFALGEQYARAVIATCKRAKVPLESVKLIGCHGQTIYHESGRNTMQIGEAAVLAERTGIPVISDFRPRDIAAGGKGAPLVPFVDELLFGSRKRHRVALNLGGIGNITSLARDGHTIAFDTGPGNMVIDALVSEYTAGKHKFDRGGRLAAKGSVVENLLAELLKDAYYKQKPPKSAGREQYGIEFVARMKESGATLPDLITTATVLTAATVAIGIQRFADGAQELIVSGGGAHNPQILGHIAALLPGVSLATSADFGVDVDAKEAIAFAILARQTWLRRPGNLPSATGARRAVVLGKLSL
jgi:anhydro-N-acetylmuramic acid kinase